MINDRTEVTNMIRTAKVAKKIKWADVASAIGHSQEWTTAACLGQMAFTKEDAEKIGAIFELTEEAVARLQIAPYKGCLPTAVPTDPLIYRWYEIVAVYGTTIKELIHEEFGDGIMSAIDFSLNISREVWTPKATASKSSCRASFCLIKPIERHEPTERRESRCRDRHRLQKRVPGEASCRHKPVKGAEGCDPVPAVRCPQQFAPWSLCLPLKLGDNCSQQVKPFNFLRAQTLSIEEMKKIARRGWAGAG
jgi:cyanate lyase